uniref:DUF4379 domain-containing protein n=1 Tax=Loa loa TaxID=7209 RepID=A0A1I7VYA3_LOALO
MDPLYGFSRTCDSTQNIEIFRENNEIQELNNYRTLASEDELSLDERHGKLIVEIRAKCFNASFVARKYTKYCPWCLAKDDMTLVESAPEKQSQPTNHLNSYLYSEQLAKSAKNVDDRYDIPWDQKCTIKRFWINENSNVNDGNTVIGSRILNRTSVPALTYLPRRTTITGTISTMSKRLSPNSSLYEYHEDSGLESV